MNLDITPEFLTGGREVSEIFRPGKLIESGRAVMSSGGAVSNTGLALVKFGMDVRLMGRCGSDAFGKSLMDILRSNSPSAASSIHVVDDEQTSYSLVLAPPGIDRMIIHYPGANNNFSAADVDYSVVASAKLFHFGYPPLMAGMIANGGAELEKMFRDARQTGVTTSLDTALPDPAGSAAKAPWTEIFTRVLPHVDIFTPSVEELMLMLDRKSYDKLVDQACGGEILPLLESNQISALADQCLAFGAAMVVIKCGYLGIYVKTAGADRIENAGRAKPGNIDHWACREIFEPSYLVDKIASATGAGDCAIAGFLTALIEGMDIDDALRCACATGAQNLSALNALDGVRSWQETIGQINSKGEKNPIDISMDGWTFDENAQHYTGPADKKVP